MDRLNPKCRKCKQNTEYTMTAFYKSMEHWDDPGYQEKAFSHIYGSGKKDGIAGVLKWEVALIACILLLKVISIAIHL